MAIAGLIPKGMRSRAFAAEERGGVRKWFALRQGALPPALLTSRFTRATKKECAFCEAWLALQRAIKTDTDTAAETTVGRSPQSPCGLTTCHSQIRLRATVSVFGPQ